MELEQRVVDTLRHLSIEKQQEVLDFVEFLARREPRAAKRRSIEGVFADAGVHLTADEIDQARREAWGNFPREDV